MNSFLKVRQEKIIGPLGKPIFLKGVNLGGWLLMEGYILHSLNIGVQAFKKEFSSRLGAKTLADFERKFQDHFIREEDFKKIARLGFNCVRLPFHHQLVESKPYRYDLKGVFYIDQAIRWAKKYRLYVILDLHAAAGCQNHDWHSDSLGSAELWTNANYQKRTFALWKFLANRYKNNSTVAGYDLLNEAVIQDAEKLNRFYEETIRVIRSVDKNHILFVEGNLWATDIKCLKRFKDENWALSVHFYHPIDFVFNFVPHLSYPFKDKGEEWNKTRIKNLLAGYKAIARKHQVPILVGEFGINSRQNLFKEADWLKDVLSSFKEQGFHWTYWTYKAVKNMMFPDGIYSYRENSPWVNRQGPQMGWATYSKLWPQHQKEIIASWDTKNFQPNKEILTVLKNAA